MYRKMKDLPADSRPYERCEMLGPEALSDTELVAVLLRTGNREKSALELAEEVLGIGGPENGLLNLTELSFEELVSLSGIGKAKAVQLLCAAELSRRLSSRKRFRRADIRDSSSLAGYYMETLRHLGHEEVRIMFLDMKAAFIGSTAVSKGTLGSSAVTPREIFAEAVKKRAASVVVVHNHPSGNTEPSEEDISFARLLLKSGRLMGIPLADFIIIGDNDYLSFAERGLI
jgi:DNA repair protein RadC